MQGTTVRPGAAQARVKTPTGCRGGELFAYAPVTPDSPSVRTSLCTTPSPVSPCIAMLAAGHVGVSAAHEPAKIHTCGSFRDDGQPIGVVIERGKPKCPTAKKVLRIYLRSHARCDGSACVRKHFGWTCASAKAPDWPRLASCEQHESTIMAYAPAD
jgi:hypothetical protein